MRRPKYDLIESAHDDMVEKTCRIANHNTLQYELVDGTVCYQLHDTVIVKRFPDGKFQLDSGGWRTVTTKARMNEFMPWAYSVYQHKSIWYVCKNFSWDNPAANGRIVYYDGIIIDPSNPLVPDKKSEREVLRVKSIMKKISAYCRKLRDIINEDGVPMPDGGDCWLCMMDGDSDNDHLRSHLDEKYVHGSLIYRALCSRRPKQGAAMIMQMGHTDIIVREVRNYFKRQLGLA